jgi:phospholipase C
LLHPVDTRHKAVRRLGWQVGAMLRMTARIVVPICGAVAAFCLFSCGTGSFVSTTPPADLSGPLSTTPIQHIVIIMQENRSFDNLFNGFPGADTAQTGMYKGVAVPLQPTPLGNGPDLDHSHPGWWREWDHGAMDNFANGTSMLAYSYVNPSELAPYWTLARNFTLGDRMFQSNTGPSFAAHQYMIAGQSGGAADTPTGAWGCGAAPGTTVPLVGPNGTDLPGVFPCFDYQTMGDLLDAKGNSWRYYAPASVDSYFINSAYQAIRHIFLGADWPKNVISPETRVLSDIAAGQLAQVTWIVPSFDNSDHPGAPALGPEWVASIVNAIGESKFWNSTAIFIAWDDWGGWYDHVPPPQIDNMGLGFRVPVIVVSPYARHGYVSHVTHESGGFLRFTESIFALPSLGSRDALSDDFSDCFDLTQTPAPYVHLQTAHRPAFFLAQKPSGPPDDD